MEETKRRPVPRKKNFGKHLVKSIPIYVMMLPGVAYLFCNNYLPMFGILIGL